MKNIFVNTRPVEFVPMHTDLRNWRFLGMEMEALGTRMDAAREALSKAKRRLGSLVLDRNLGSTHVAVASHAYHA
jgi:hypothetical protein